MKQLPAIVISGFLGAGKTTLLNRLLAHGLAGKKAGLIVNDFGKLHIDGQLVNKGDHPLLELANGCVCCTLQLGLSEAVRTLAASSELDLLIVEASGISLTSALLHALRLPDLADCVRVSNVTAVIDARRYPQVLHSLPLIRDQVSQASLILLNHCDEVNATTINEAKDRLRRDNPDAPIVATEHGNITFYDLFSASQRPATLERLSRHDQHWHAYEVVLPDNFEADRLVALVDQLPQTVERVKGFIARGDELHVLQKVGPFPAGLESRLGENENGVRDSLVIIAREPIAVKLEQIFTGCSIVSAGMLTHDGMADPA